MNDRKHPGRPALAHALLLLVVTGYLLVGSLYATRTPAWQSPDEPAHYNYIRQLAGGRLPVMAPQDYDENYRAEIVSARFAPPYTIEPLTYEDWQPPLYYLLQTPLFLLFDGALLPLRFFSLLLGAGIILLAYTVARRMWPGRSWLALTAAAFVAFLPQHVALLASVNNDSLAELLIAAILWCLLAATGSSRPDGTQTPARAGGPLWLASGMFLGLGFLTKATVYIMVPVIALALIWYFWQRWRALLLTGLLSFVPAVLLGSLWWVRNLSVYGWPDLLGKQAHDAAVIGQKQTATWIAEIGVGPAARSFLQTTFQSFWGQFGWMGVVMDRRIYLALLLFTLLVLAGLLWRLFNALRPDNHQAVPNLRSPGSTPQPRIPDLQSLLLLTTFLLSLALFLGYNLTYVQHQGRYLFPALIPISLAVTLGIDTWVRPLVSRWPASAWFVPAGLALALAALDLLALFFYIVPQLT